MAVWKAFTPSTRRDVASTPPRTSSNSPTSASSSSYSAASPPLLTSANNRTISRSLSPSALFSFYIAVFSIFSVSSRSTRLRCFMRNQLALSMFGCVSASSSEISMLSHLL